MAKNSRRKPQLHRNGAVVWILILFAVFFYVLKPYVGPVLKEIKQTLLTSETSTQTEETVPLPSSSLMEVHFLDVGQGDSELIRIPAGDKYFNILIDAGDYSHADGVVNYLENAGVQQLDAVVATHPHADHIGAMATVLKHFSVGKFYMPVVPEKQTPTSKAYEKMLDVLLDKKISVTSLSAGTYIDLPVGASAEVFAPKKDEAYDDLNNYSAVIKITYGKTAFLFTGDAEKESEKWMLSQNIDLSAQVLKVGHHGSSSSTTRAFLDAVAPEYAVISCETGNSYGHPHKETMASLQKFGCEILRTDEMQTIVIESNGTTLDVLTKQPKA